MAHTQFHKEPGNNVSGSGFGNPTASGFLTQPGTEGQSGFDFNAFAEQQRNALSSQQAQWGSFEAFVAAISGGG